jgi:hypothetical protein
MVRSMEMRKFPRVGDRVIAPFGLSEVKGEVIYISYTFDPPAVTIEFKFDEYDNELHTMVYSADQLRPADMVAT